MKIKSVKAMEVFDSRGNPTVKAIVLLEDGAEGCAITPSGASTGAYEAKELRDGNIKRFYGKGVLSAVNNINTEIAAAIIGLDASNQFNIDNILINLDGTKDKSRLGANAMLAVSLALSRAAAKSSFLPLYKYINGLVTLKSKEMNMPVFFKIQVPFPLVNIINGGAHANWITDMQEYMLIPSGFASFKESIRVCAEIYFSLKEIIIKRKDLTGVGDEGGFMPNVRNNNEPLILMAEATKHAGYMPGENITFGIDAAASAFFKEGFYFLKKDGQKLSSEELANFYHKIISENNVTSIEDPFTENDWNNFGIIASRYENKIQIVGDDLYATNSDRLRKGINAKATNAVIVKPNQIGTLSETLEFIVLARYNNQKLIISHRSGDTEDSFIADLAAGAGSEYIKSGAPSRGERTAKYNRLMEIEEELGQGLPVKS